jgi:hypothetical protein
MDANSGGRLSSSNGRSIMNLTLPTVDVASARADLAELGPRAKSAIADISKSDTSQAVSGVVADAGQAVSGAVADAGQLVSGALAAAGDRLRELRPTPEPRRRSIAPIAIGGAVVGAIAVAVGTAAAFLMDPIQGARRRAAVRRRVDAVAERVRLARGIVQPTRLLQAPPPEVIAVPIEMGPGDPIPTEAAHDFTDGAVPVGAATAAAHNGSGHDSDVAAAEAPGE